MGSNQDDPRKLFSPLKVGDMDLFHTVIMSPLTRTRCPNGIPTELNAEYYAQRTTPSGLLISEGAMPSFMAGNLHNAPGIYTPEHIQGWKLVTEAVHAKGGFIFCQLWHFFRHNGMPNRYTRSGEREMTGIAKAMTPQDIKVTIAKHVHAAQCAIEAGFDGVEITSANGYLLDQYLNSNTNNRTDDYGGTPQNRARFTLQVLDAVISSIGASKVGIRFSPWGTVMMPLDKNPVETFSYVLEEVGKRKIAYVVLAMPRTDLFIPEDVKLGNIKKAIESGEVVFSSGENESEDGDGDGDGKEISLSPFWRALVKAESDGNGKTARFVTWGYNGTNCFEEVERGEVDGVSFGRSFIGNPDLIERVRVGAVLRESVKELWYRGGREGYTDYERL